MAVCCAEDTGSGVIHVSLFLSHPLCVSLSLVIFGRLSPCPLSKMEQGTMRVCGSSKVRLRYGIKCVLLLLGQDLQAAGQQQPMLTILA